MSEATQLAKRQGRFQHQSRPMDSAVHHRARARGQLQTSVGRCKIFQSWERDKIIFGKLNFLNRKRGPRLADKILHEG